MTMVLEATAVAPQLAFVIAKVRDTVIEQTMLFAGPSAGTLQSAAAVAQALS